MDIHDDLQIYIERMYVYADSYKVYLSSLNTQNLVNASRVTFTLLLGSVIFYWVGIEQFSLDIIHFLEKSILKITILFI